MFFFLLPHWASSVCVRVYVCVLIRFGHVQFFATLWTLACKAPLSMGFSRQEYWSGLPCPPPGDLPNPGIKPASRMSPALAGGFFTTRTTWEAHMCVCLYICIYKHHAREQIHTFIYLVSLNLWRVCLLSHSITQSGLTLRPHGLPSSHGNRFCVQWP